MNRSFVLCCMVVMSYGCGKEATHRGKGVAQWRESLRESDPQARREAAEALGKIGPRAKAALPELSAALKDSDDGVRTQAVIALWAMGPDARPVVPDLAALLRGDKISEVRLNAAGALAVCGTARTWSPHSARLKDRDSSVRAAAAKALMKIGKPATGAVGALAEALKDKDGSVRVAAAYALAEIGPDARAAVTALQTLARSKDRMDHSAAAHALGKITVE